MIELGKTLYQHRWITWPKANVQNQPPTTIILFIVAGIIQANFWSTLRLIILQGCLGLHGDSRIISRKFQDVLQSTDGSQSSSLVDVVDMSQVWWKISQESKTDHTLMFVSFIFNNTGVVFFLITSQDYLSFTVKPLYVGLTIFRGGKLQFFLLNIEFTLSKRHRDLFCFHDNQTSLQQHC